MIVVLDVLSREVLNIFLFCKIDWDRIWSCKACYITLKVYTTISGSDFSRILRLPLVDSRLEPKLGKLPWLYNPWATEMDLEGDWTHNLKPNKVNLFSVTWIPEVSLFSSLTLGLVLDLLIYSLLFSLTFCFCQCEYKDISKWRPQGHWDMFGSET